MITLGFITAQDQESSGSGSSRTEPAPYKPPIQPVTNPSTAIQNLLREQEQAANEARIDAQEAANQPTITALAVKKSNAGYYILGGVGLAVVVAGIFGIRLARKSSQKDKKVASNASV